MLIVMGEIGVEEVKIDVTGGGGIEGEGIEVEIEGMVVGGIVGGGVVVEGRRR